MTSTGLLTLAMLILKGLAIGVEAAKIAAALREITGRMVAENRNPTDAEWFAILADMGADHDEIQALRPQGD